MHWNKHFLPNTKWCIKNINYILDDYSRFHRCKNTAKTLFKSHTQDCLYYCLNHDRVNKKYCQYNLCFIVNSNLVWRTVIKHKQIEYFSLKYKVLLLNIVHVEIVGQHKQNGTRKCPGKCISVCRTCLYRRLHHFYNIIMSTPLHSTHPFTMESISSSVSKVWHSSIYLCSVNCLHTNLMVFRNIEEMDGIYKV